MTPTHYTIAAVQVAVHAFRDAIPPELRNETALPVFAAPGSWLRQLCQDQGQPEDMVPQFIHDCPVVQQDELDGPVLITHDAKIIRLSGLTPAMGREEVAPNPRTAVALS